MKINLLVLFGLATLLLSEPIQAQQQSVTGMVTDGSEGLPGVSVQIDGTSTGTITDLDGKYVIKANPGDILKFSYVGFKSQMITLGNQTVLDIILEINAEELEEVVVIGYGTEKKSDATGSMETLDPSSINKGSAVSPESLLNGRVAGVQMTPNSGQPGAEQNVRIRGVNSITASSEPLYVVDGVPIDNNRSALERSGDAGVNSAKLNPLAMISPNDIESISVLKDASATAIYGSRGANGVIIIKTKNGSVGKGSLTYDSYVTVSEVSNTIDLLDANQFSRFDTTAGGGSSTNWQDEIFRSAVTQSHNISLSGGTEKLQYRGSIGVRDQEGIVLGTGLKTINSRLNVNQSLLDDKLKVQFNISHSNYETDNIVEQQTGGASGGVINNALKADPTQPIRNADGSYNEWASQVFNPVALAEQIDDITSGNRLIASAAAEYFFIDELSLKVNLANDYDQQKRRIYQPIASAIGGPISGRAIREDAEYSNELIETYFNYKVSKTDYDFTGLLGYSWQEFTTDLTNVVATGFDNDNLGFNSLAGQNQIAIALREQNRLISFFGRASFNWQDRYLLTATLRRDGSSKFGGENQWGLFPSAALAWKISNEAFMDNQEAFTNLKLRLGYGVTGNQNIGNFRQVSTITVNQLGGATFGDQYVIPYTYTSVPNEELQWEETAQTNLGLDFGLMKDRLTGSVDFYNKVTSNLLLEARVPQPEVASVVLDNVGEMKNTGIELNVNYAVIEEGDFTWDLNLNLSRNRNEITALINGEDIESGVISGAGAAGNPQILRVGESIGSFYGFEFESVDAEGNEVYKDQDGDNEITADDRVIIGKALPDVTWGLTSRMEYKGIDFSFLIRGQQNAQVFNNTRAELTQPNRLPGQNTNQEGADGRNNNAYLYNTSRWVENANFLRLDNLTLGYTFNTSKIPGVSYLRAYFTGQNLFVITDYTGFDPEVNTTAGSSTALSYGVDYTAYPQARSYQLGLSLKF